MTKKQILTIISACISCIIIFVYIFFFTKRKPPKKVVVQKKEIIQKAEVIARNVSLKEIAPEKLKGWKINAAISKFFKDRDEIVCNDIVCKLITQDNEIAHLVSGTTKINIKTKDVFLKGKVSGSFSDFQLFGKDFLYSFEKHLIETDKKVFLKHPQMNIESNKTHIDLKDERIILSGGIKSDFYMDEAQA
jgi:LPS export ABC transporter protein LptC